MHLHLVPSGDAPAVVHTCNIGCIFRIKDSMRCKQMSAAVRSEEDVKKNGACAEVDRDRVHCKRWDQRSGMASGVLHYPTVLCTCTMHTIEDKRRWSRSTAGDRRCKGDASSFYIECNTMHLHQRCMLYIFDVKKKV